MKILSICIKFWFFFIIENDCNPYTLHLTPYTVFRNFTLQLRCYWTRDANAAMRTQFLWIFPKRIVSVLLLYTFILDSILDPISWWHVFRVREMITFFTKTITKRTPLGQRQSVQNEGKSIRFIFSLC